VTPEEVEAATFAGVAEKVMFSRALSDMESADEAARIKAARMLAGIRHELTVRALAGWLAREPAAGVRKECVKALTRLGLPQVVPVVERALADAAASVRLAAVHAVYRLGGPGGAIALVPILRDENEDVRRRAATCIGWLGEKRLAGDLLPLLADRSAAVRCAVLEAMENLRSPQVVTRVIELLDDPEESVRQKAFGVVGAITGERLAAALPEDEASRHRLIARWRARWEDESRIAGTQ
jgi:HEAT repeat protein